MFQHIDSLIYTGDRKLYCQGERYTEFPATYVTAETELVVCGFQFFTEFPVGTFSNMPYLLALDVSCGSLEKLSKQTFQGASNLRYLNISGSELHGEIFLQPHPRFNVY